MFDQQYSPQTSSRALHSTCVKFRPREKKRGEEGSGVEEGGAEGMRGPSRGEEARERARGVLSVERWSRK